MIAAISTRRWLALLGMLALVGCTDDGVSPREPSDDELIEMLAGHGFTGRMETELETRLGRPIDSELADLGRILFFDRFIGLHSDANGTHGNSCAGCHSPAAGFGDTQPIAIGVDNNDIVGPDRRGPRNQRRSPLLVNIAFAPRLMWDGRFFSPVDDPFDNSQGFHFPEPEGTSRFGPNDPVIRHLLQAQAHIPPTELPEMAGFTGTAGTAFASFVERQSLGARDLIAAARTSAMAAGVPTDIFDDGHGSAVPAPNPDGFRNERIRDAVVARLNAHDGYRQEFRRVFDGVAAGDPIDFSMIGLALAEFQLSLTFMNAPIDQYARGDLDALTESQKRGALLFFGRVECVACHAVSGKANEMFSDFENYRIGVPPLAPQFGVGTGNVEFAGPGADEDFGAEHSTADPDDRYRFRTSPLRNLAVQPNFFHNGAFDRLEDAILHHLDVIESARSYDPAAHGVPADLRAIRPPLDPVLEDIHARLRTPIALTTQELDDLVEFVRNGLLDPRARPENLCPLIPASVPSGMTLMVFQGC